MGSSPSHRMEVHLERNTRRDCENPKRDNLSKPKRKKHQGFHKTVCFIRKLTEESGDGPWQSGSRSPCQRAQRRHSPP
jgi:hypothetical protein